jgi:hypothetical protein
VTAIEENWILFLIMTPDFYHHLPSTGACFFGMLHFLSQENYRTFQNGKGKDIRSLASK